MSSLPTPAAAAPPSVAGAAVVAVTPTAALTASAWALAAALVLVLGGACLLLGRRRGGRCGGRRGGLRKAWTPSWAQRLFLGQRSSFLGPAHDGAHCGAHDGAHGGTHGGAHGSHDAFASPPHAAPSFLGGLLSAPNATSPSAAARATRSRGRGASSVAESVRAEPLSSPQPLSHSQQNSLTAANLPVPLPLIHRFSSPWWRRATIPSRQSARRYAIASCAYESGMSSSRPRCVHSPPPSTAPSLHSPPFHRSSFTAHLSFTALSPSPLPMYVRVRAQSAPAPSHSQRASPVPPPSHAQVRAGTVGPYSAGSSGGGSPLGDSPSGHRSLSGHRATVDRAARSAAHRLLRPTDARAGRGRAAEDSASGEPLELGGVYGGGLDPGCAGKTAEAVRLPMAVHSHAVPSHPQPLHRPSPTPHQVRLSMAPSAWLVTPRLSPSVASWTLDLYSYGGADAGATPDELLATALALCRAMDVQRTLGCTETALQTFLIAVCQGYLPQPFHNFSHGVYVLQASPPSSPSLGAFFSRPPSAPPLLTLPRAPRAGCRASSCC